MSWSVGSLDNEKRLQRDAASLVLTRSLFYGKSASISIYFIILHIRLSIIEEGGIAGGRAEEIEFIEFIRSFG
jgi:hypothetical protein